MTNGLIMISKRTRFNLKKNESTLTNKSILLENRF